MLNILPPELSEATDDPNKPKPKPDPITGEIRTLFNRPMPYDNKSVKDLTKSVATKLGISPSLLLSSAFQEGMNKAIVKPDEVSEAYTNAKVGNDYPIDGFYNYGLDTFGDKAKELIQKGYLPQDFQNSFQAYRAMNDARHPNPVMTAAFKNNEAALTAKAAMIKELQDNVQQYAKSKGVELDPEAQNYFTLAGYNGGEGTAKKLLDRYAAASDKKSFIANGDKAFAQLQQHISPRLARIKDIDKLYSDDEQSQPPIVQSNLKPPSK